MNLFLIIFLAISPLICLTRTAEEWKSRVIYQIVTDRFGQTQDVSNNCTTLSDYCGGTFKGIERNLDYIQGMGANAIWISPIIQNAPGGYHGYWHTNFYEVNEHFGTKQDLKDLINACHERDIWVMVDVVPNHVAPVSNYEDFSSIFPFNDPKYYHWPVYLCQEIDRIDPTNQSALEDCWLSYLPDLNHNDEFVARTLLEWVRDLVQTFNIDGIRLDATRHIPKWFWYEFSKASGVFTVGEVWNYDVIYVGGYQGPVDSLLNFPFHSLLDQTFQIFTDMSVFGKYFQQLIYGWSDASILVNFLDNHDIPRFLFSNPDMGYYKAAYTMVLCSMGIPVIYYGDEQSFTGGVDPENREPLWGKMDANSEMYQYFKVLNSFRQRTEFYKYVQIQRLSDTAFYAFTRGQYFFAFTNSPEVQMRTIKSHPYSEGTILCNAFNEEDCVEVKDGVFQMTLINKEVKILFPLEKIEEGKIKESAWKELHKIWSKNSVRDMRMLSLSLIPDKYF